MQIKKIGVISDTHIPKTAPDLPESVYRELQNVDMILHAGDIDEMALLERLQKIAPTHAVYGNMDMPEVKAALLQKEIIEVEGFKIGLIHGYGPRARVADAVAKEFTRVDVIVFGHSHSPFNEKIKKTLFFNPGSPTDKVFAAYNSFGILEVGKEITGRIVKLS
ncbi:MAG: metallophosphoesterase family protein [Candidatus Omnitrophica bacterium]|nr:metallophosphoesterase family protein [Candidatus Omnitrophota bacterium]